MQVNSKSSEYISPPENSGSAGFEAGFESGFESLTAVKPELPSWLSSWLSSWGPKTPIPHDDIAPHDIAAAQPSHRY